LTTEHQLVTGGIFYCRDSAGFSVSASNKLLCILTGQCFEIGNKNIPPIRYASLYGDSDHSNTVNKILWTTFDQIKILPIFGHKLTK